MVRGSEFLGEQAAGHQQRVNTRRGGALNIGSEAVSDREHSRPRFNSEKLERKALDKGMGLAKIDHLSTKFHVVRR